MSAGIFFNHKEPLIFYNNSDESRVSKSYKSPKSRRSRYETNKKHQKRVDNWKTQPTVKMNVKPKENSMTQKYYAEHILSTHIKHIKWLESYYHHSF